jgi:hypothetical protein
MAYSAPTAKQFREKAGSLADKIASELGLIDTELDNIEAGDLKQDSNYAVLTAGIGTPTALGTAGIDLASGSDIQIYGVFFAPKAVTVIALHTYLIEAYVKDTSDAKIEVYDDAGSPNKVFGRTMTAAGEPAKQVRTISPETGRANLAAGTRLDLKAVNTGSSTGTGHAIVILEYKET